MSEGGLAAARSTGSGIHRIVLATVLSVLLLTTALFAVKAAAKPGESGLGRYIVVLEDDVKQPGAVAQAQSANNGGRLGFVYRHALKGYSAVLPNATVDRLRSDPRVAHVEPDVRGGVAAQTTPTGIGRSFAAGNETLDIDEEDDIRVDVDVAVLDTGIDYQHPDLNVVARADCSMGTQEKAECVDESGVDGHTHGTHVAGTVAAIDNGVGVVGVAPGARLWAVKVLDSGGGGFLSEYIAGIDWVTEHASEIEVANSSLRYLVTSSLAFSEAMAASVDAGVVHVVAAGNESETVKYVPGNHPDVVTVSALADYNGEPGGGASPTCQSLGSDDKLASFSNFGPSIEVAAPGVCTYSTEPGGYGTKSGTSMASPHVAGAAAILASVTNPANQSDVEAIRSTIIEEGNLNWEDTSGDGTKEPLLDVSDEEVFVGHSSAPAPPEATTGTASNVQPTTATLNGVVDPNNVETTYQFEYGTTTEYGSKVPASAKGAGSGGFGVQVSEQVEGLEPDTTYHFRIVANSTEGTDFGGDKTFTTAGDGEWVTETSPNKSTVEGSEQALESVDCHSQNWCMAVGDYSNGEGSGALAELWTGNEWTIVTTPAGVAMNGVVCHAATECAAVGSKEGGARIERWIQGSGWFAMTLPSIEGTSSVLNAISCTGGFPTLKCFAVGTHTVSGAERTLALRWNGTWEVRATPDPGTGSMLSGVHCNSANDCVAVGSYVESGEEHPMAMHWDGTEWSTETVPDPESEGEDSRLADVSCTDGGFTCVAVGVNEGGSPQHAIGMVRENGKWAERPVAEPSEGTAASLLSVSCDEQGLCGAVGSAKVESASLPLAEVFWTGSGWTAEQAADPSEGGGGTLAGVNCESTEACLAVGSYSGSGAELTLVERRVPAEPSGPKAPTATTEAASGVTTSKATLNGTVNPNGASTTYQFEYGTTESYGSKVPASPQGIGSGTSNVAVDDAVEGLSASTTYHFRVVATNSKGTTYGKDKTFTTEAEEEAEPEWAIEATANPSEAEGSEQTLTDVSCFSGSWCMAVGSYSNGGGSGALAEYSTGEGWTIVSVPGGVVLNDVLCRPFVNECAAVGKKEGQLWSARWHKALGFWVDMKPPKPEGAESSEFKGGDCSPKNEIFECVVVGSYTVSGEERPLAMEWIIAKQEWAVLSPSTKGEDSSFNAVSCNQEGSCTAVGHYVESGDELPLAEHWNGTGWSVQSVPAIEAEGEDTSLADIACTGEAGPSTDCVAVGSNQGGAAQTGVAVFWNGAEWKVAGPVTPGGLAGDFSLSGVSCVSQSECYAVGEYDSAAEGAGTKPLAEEWNGTAWSISPTPSPAGKSWSGLGSVSCGASFKCLAVGFGESATRTDTLAMRHE